VGRDRITFEPATRAHAEELAPRMRHGDAAEILASCGHRPLAGLLASLKWSEAHGEAWAGLIDGEVAGIFGVGKRTLLSTSGIPWLLTGDLVERHPLLFWRASRAVLATWLERFEFLEQFVDARYTQALRWAERLGFKVEEGQPIGRGGLLFCHITIRRK
jgi:hypothetical protein